jgi:hypothetical protein
MRSGSSTKTVQRAAAIRMVAVILAATLGGVVFPALAGAAGTPSWYEQITLNGLVSTSFHHNFNRPDSRTNGYRVFDFREATFQVDVAELAVQKAASAPGDVGFSIHLTAGSAIPRVTASAGMFRDDEGHPLDFDVHQALATYILPVGKGVRLDFGKHVTHMGYEVIDGYDGVNDSVTRSLLFGYCIPFTQTGLRAGYPVTERLSASLFLVNGWDNALDNNRSKSVGAQIVLTPARGTSLLLNYLGGAERDSTSDLRHVIDVVGVYKPTDRVSFGMNLDYGMEAKALPTGDDATWKGLAGYARVGISGPFAVSARAELLDDPDGYRTGVDQQLEELTLTPEWRPAPNFMLRMDIRTDRSNHEVFERRGEPASRKTQNTISLNALCTF